MTLGHYRSSDILREVHATTARLGQGLLVGVWILGAERKSKLVIGVKAGITL